MRFIMPTVTLQWDSESQIMARSGELVGLTRSRAVWRFGWMRGSDLVITFGLQGLDEFLWVISTPNGTVIHQWAGLAVDLPRRYTEIINGPQWANGIVPPLREDHTFRIEVREFYVYEGATAFWIVNKATGQERGMGDGVDLFSEGDSENFIPVGTAEFYAALAADVVYNQAQYMEAYFGEEAHRGDNS